MSAKILAIESSTDYGSIALCYGDEVLSYEMEAPRQHSSWLLSAIESLLAEAGLAKGQLDAISFGRGPGSFTGIRLATSIAQTMAFLLDIPVIPVSSLQALGQYAWRKYGYHQVLVALDARLQQVYWGCYQHDPHNNLMQLWGEEGLAFPQQVGWPTVLLSKAWRGIGDGWDHYQEQLKGEWIAGGYPKAYDIAIIARDEYQQDNVIPALAVKPVYLRNEIAHTVSC